MPTASIDTSNPITADALGKLSFENAAAWVKERTFVMECARHKGEPITRLLWDTQHDAESRSCFQHVVDRLENMQAVQNMSQWQLTFDPNTQSVCLHQLKVHRGDQSIEYAIPGKARILQREQDLESHILHGSVTMLILLEDIRPGDILESSFTIRDTPRLLPNAFSCNRLSPNSIHLSKAFYSIRYPSALPLKWKTGSTENAPVIQEQDGITELLWENENKAAVLSEPEMPTWCLARDWIQVSDLQSWSEISHAAKLAWAEQSAVSSIETEIARLCQDVESIPDKIEKIIHYVQDEFRYLSVRAEVGGQIPADPDLVISRRYGDCKDLSHLLAHMLNGIGVTAYPVLVHNLLGKQLPEMLPCPDLFNHVVVEYALEGSTHWVDPTIKLQGGNSQTRFVPEYYYGLRVKDGSETLVQQPNLDGGAGKLHIHETFMLDSAGNPNLLRIQTVAMDSFADNYRRMLDDNGVEGFQEVTLERASSRYNIGETVESVQYEDDRDQNTWRMVELYMIPPLSNLQDRHYTIELPANFVQLAIALPEDKKREFPFFIPRNLQLTHLYEFRCKAVQRRSPRKNIFQAHGVAFSVKVEPSSRKWKLITRLDTQVDHVPAEKMSSFKKMMENMLKASNLAITVPYGHIRIHRETNFFSLPEMPKFESLVSKKAVVQSASSSDQKQQRIAAHPDHTSQLTSRRSSGSSRSRSRRSQSRHRHVMEDEVQTRKIVYVVCILISVILGALKIFLVN